MKIYNLRQFPFAANPVKVILIILAGAIIIGTAMGLVTRIKIGW